MNNHRSSELTLSYAEMVRAIQEVTTSSVGPFAPDPWVG